MNKKEEGWVNYNPKEEINEILSPLETLNLVRQAKNGSQDAKKTLLVHNQRLIIHIAKHINARNGLHIMDDLIQEGNIGLLHAIDVFNEEKSDNFINYAASHIKAFMLRYVKNNVKMIRKPIWVEDRNTQIRAYIMEKEQRNEKVIVEELMTKFKLSSYEAMVFLNKTDECISLQMETRNGEKDTTELMSFVKSSESIEEEVISEFIKEDLYQALVSLPEELKEVIIARYLTEKKVSLGKLSEKYHISKEAVRLREKKALRILRKRLEESSYNIEDFAL